MGFNSTILILNDRLGDIEKNEKLGEQISSELMAHCGNRQKPYCLGGWKVMSQTHADSVSVILVGGNTHKVIGIERSPGLWAGHTPQADEGVVKILKSIAADYGYRLVRKTPSSKSAWNRMPYRGNGFSF